MFKQQDIQLPCGIYKKYATLYIPQDTAPRASILYFHGGGLLYGHRKDLPQAHIEALTQAGYALLAFDYPLAPGALIDCIQEDVCASVNTYCRQGIGPIKKNTPYFLWGRSAGAYLCLLAAAFGKLDAPPLGLLSYYGYGFLCDFWFERPSSYYLEMPALSSGCLKALPREIHSLGPVDTHYGAYVYARQKGIWKSMFYKGEKGRFFLDYSLRQVKALPCPLFLAHSINDPDVPYDEFLALAETYHGQRYISVSGEHDFDRTESPFLVSRLMEATVGFLEKCQTQA